MNEIQNEDISGNINKSILHTITITQDDMKALILIRNYFGENDKTQLEHFAYDVLNRVVNPFLGNVNLKIDSEE